MRLIKKTILITLICVIFITGCVEEKVISTEIPSTNITPTSIPTVNETPIAEATSTLTPEPSEIWPKYVITYDRLMDPTIEYSNGQRVKITEVITTTIMQSDLEIVTSDLKVTLYMTFGYMHSSGKLN